MAVPTRLLRRWLSQLDNRNAQGEYYLTDVVKFAVADRVPENNVATSVTFVAGKGRILVLTESETAAAPVLKVMRESGIGCLAVEAGRTIVIEPETCATLASGYGVSVVGVSPGDATRSAVGS